MTPYRGHLGSNDGRSLGHFNGWSLHHFDRRNVAIHHQASRNAGCCLRAKGGSVPRVLSRELSLTGCAFALAASVRSTVALL